MFGFSLSAASFEVLQFLAMVVAPSGLSNQGAQLYHFVSGNLGVNREGCGAACAFPGIIAKGDRAGVTVTGRHKAAEAARQRRHTG